MELDRASRYIIEIPWDARAPLTEEMAATAIGKPIRLGFMGDEIGTIVAAAVERDPDRLGLVYKLDEEGRERRQGALSIEVDAAKGVLGAVFILALRVAAERSLTMEQAADAVIRTANAATPPSSARRERD